MRPTSPRDLTRSVISRMDALLVPARTTVYPMILLVLWMPIWALLMSRSANPLMVDLVARWSGGHLVWNGRWRHLYDPAAQEALQRRLFNDTGTFSWFVGPPFEAVLLAPLGALPYPVALVVWTTASIGALVGSLWLVRNRLRFGDLWWRRLVVIAFGSMATIECLFAGQNSTFILLVVMLSWLALRSGRDLAAGAILGLALLKPHLILLLLLLWLLEGRWRAIAGFITVAALWTGLVVLQLDSSVFGDWLVALGSDHYNTAVTLGQTAKQAGPAGVVSGLLVAMGSKAGAAASVASLALGSCAIVWLHRRERDPLTRWCLAVLVSVVFAPHAMVYDLVIVIPSLAVALNRWWTPSLRVTLALAWMGLWLNGPIVQLTGLSPQGVLITLMTLLVLAQAGRPSSEIASSAGAPLIPRPSEP